MHNISRAYLAHLELKRCTSATLHGRGHFLDKLERDLGCPPVEASAAEVAAWYAAQPRRLTPRSQATMLSQVRSFYRWAQCQGHRPDDPTRMLPRPHVAPGRPRPMATRDVFACIQVAQGRNFAAIALGAYAGMRAIEVSRCERSWLQPDGNLIITGKGNRTRLVPAHPLVVRAFTASERDLLFPMLDGRQATAGVVSKAMNRWLHERMGLGDTFHSLRHWFGTQLYQSSRDLRLVQDLMGHSSPQTTAVYADYYRPDASAAVAHLEVA